MKRLDGKKFLIVGMAKSGVEAAYLALSRGAEISLYDAKPAAAFSDHQALIDQAAHRYFNGKDPIIEYFDSLIVSPGVPLDLPFISAAKRRAKPVISEIEFAAQFASGRMVGITGTNGKTTTTAMTTQALRACGLQAIACGNIGIPLSKVVRENPLPEHVYVVELSSYQLESIERFRADIAVILNITPDHLQRHGSMARYIEAKRQIFKNSVRRKDAILNLDNANTRQIADQMMGCTTFSAGDYRADIRLIDRVVFLKAEGVDRALLHIDEMFVKGRHNVENAMATLAICWRLQQDLTTAARAICAFKGVAHRFEHVVDIDGLTFYNDSKATNPEASLPALKALDKSTILIAGGMDKGSDYRVLFDSMHFVDHVILLGETKQDIAYALEKFGYRHYTLVDTMEQAVQLAIAIAVRPANILLSPFCASWDMYRNFEARGDHFKQCVNDYIVRNRNEQY